MDVNEIAVRKYGYSRKEFLSMTIQDIRPVEEKKKLLESQQLIKDQEGIIHFGLFTHLKKDKTAIKVEVSGNKFSFKGKDCILVVSTDVTERESALSHLKSNEKKLLAAQNIAKIGYWKIDLQNDNIFWSDEVFNILSINKETYTPNYELFLQLVHPDDVHLFVSERNEAVAGEKEIDLEFRIMEPNGGYKWILQKGKLVKNEKGKPIKFEGSVQDITEAKLLKLSLEESNRRYELVTRATFDAIYDWNFTTDECYWGDGFQKGFGYDLQTLSDKSFWHKHAHLEDHDRVVNEIRKAVNSRATNLLTEYRLQKADGIYAYVMDRSIIVRDENGTGIRLVGAIQDITEKRNLQQLLDKANRLAKIGSFEIDVETNTVYWSDIVKEIREVPDGYSPTLEDGMGHFKEGYSKETILARVKDAVKNGTPWQEDLQIYTHKGNLKWMRTIGKAEIVNGKCVKVYGSFQDIDEQKKAEIEIRKLYEEKDTILESIGDAFCTVNKNWIVTYWNKEAEKILITPKNKIIGNLLWEVFPDIIDSEAYKKYHQSMATHKAVFFEYYYPSLDKWFDINAYPSDQGLSVYLKDITDRKFSEIELKKLHTDLQKTAADLAVSNHELEQFAYIASHDLQEPLRMVTSFLSQLEKKYFDIIDEKGKQYIHFAVDGAKRMRQIILDLLEFSRVGRFEGTLEEVNTNEVLEEIILLYKKQLEDTNAIIQFDLLPVVQTYKTPLRQVIQNLVSNALKYQQPGKPPIIHIAAKETPTHWKFSVEDNGIGIDSEYFERIFVIFQRLHNKDEYSGTGMGLAIVKRIIETLGGAIWVESTTGKGSTFFFTIKR